jgi:HAD superfamily hydrolase (TIGR01458 family)
MTASGVEAVLLDIDGVLVVSWEALPGAPESLTWLRDNDVPYLLATNTTTLSRASLADKLREAGFDVDAAQLITAPAITAAYLASHHRAARCFLLAKGDVADDLEGVSIVDDDADVVIVAGAEEAFSYDNMNRAYRMLSEGAALVAMHRNVSWMTSEGPKLDAGPYIRALEEAAGVEASVMGKPSPDFFREAVRILGAPAERVAMIGDDVANDVLAAQDVGLTGVLVRTGKFTPESLERAPARPDHVLDSIADLPAEWVRISR